MVRNSFTLSAICGGAPASTKPINSAMTLMLELQNNPILEDKLFALMNNQEIVSLVSDPLALKEFMNFIDKMDPDFIKTLPALCKQMSLFYGPNM